MPDRKDDTDKRKLLGLDKDKPLPKFGKRTVRPPVTEDEKHQKKLEEFQDQARALLQEGRDRDAEEANAAKAGARRKTLFRFGRSQSDANTPPAEPETTEEEEWRRRMARKIDLDPDED